MKKITLNTVASDDRLTRQQACDLIGAVAVAEVETRSCELTSRLLSDGDDRTEWRADSTGMVDGRKYILSIYYMTTPQDSVDVEANGGDWGGVDWEKRVECYTIAVL